VNEVLGLPTTLGDHVITREEIERCCEDRSFATSLNEVLPAWRPYLLAGIDWGGGGVSGTVLVIGHPTTDRKFKILRFDRWLPHEDPDVVLTQLTARLKQFGIRCIAADGAGNGLVYNRMLYKNLQATLGPPTIFSIDYLGHAEKPVGQGVLLRWSINRSETIGGLMTRLKLKMIQFPSVAESSSFLEEFTCELVEFDPAMRIVKYTKSDTDRDDALHATNYAETVGFYVARQAGLWE
jgi:hypothetical protein